jgi:hypothetical protein
MKSLAKMLAALAVSGAFAVSGGHALAASKTKHVQTQRLFCPDSPWRCTRYIRGTCKGHFYTDVYGDLRCVPPGKNGRKHAQYLPSWGSGLFDR